MPLKWDLWRRGGVAAPSGYSPVGSSTQLLIRNGESANIGTARNVKPWKVFHLPTLSDTAAHPILKFDVYLIFF